MVSQSAVCLTAQECSASIGRSLSVFGHSIAGTLIGGEMHVQITYDNGLNGKG